MGVLGDCQPWVGGRASAMLVGLVHVGRRKSEETELMTCKKKKVGVISVCAWVCVHVCTCVCTCVVCVSAKEEVEAVLVSDCCM